MSTNRNTGRNKWTGGRFRELVALVLSVSGFEQAEARPIAARHGKPSDRLIAADADDLFPTDVTGLPGVIVHVRADTQAQLSTSLDAVEISRDLAGADHGVLVQYRRSRTGFESYALMSLSGWAKLAKLALAAEEKK